MNKGIYAALIFFGALLSLITIYIQASRIGDRLIQICFWAFIVACWGGWKFHQKYPTDKY